MTSNNLRTIFKHSAWRRAPKFLIEILNNKFDPTVLSLGQETYCAFWAFKHVNCSHWSLTVGWCLYFLLDFGVLYQLDLNSLWKSDAKNIFLFHLKWFLSLSSDFEVFASVRPYARICVFWWAAAVCRRTVGQNWAMVQKPSYLPQPMLARSIKVINALLYYFFLVEPCEHLFFVVERFLY